MTYEAGLHGVVVNLNRIVIAQVIFLLADLLTFTYFDHIYGEKSCFQGARKLLMKTD